MDIQVLVFLNKKKAPELIQGLFINLSNLD